MRFFFRRSKVTRAADQSILLRNLGPGLAPTGSRNRKVNDTELVPYGYE